MGPLRMAALGAIVALLAVGTAPAAATAPAPDAGPGSGPDAPQVWHGSLGLAPIRMPHQGEVCLNEDLQLWFSVTASDYEFPKPVAEAMVEVSDNHGIAKSIETSAAGQAGITWRVSEAGPLTLTVKASKQDWTAPPPLTFRYDANPCEWLLHVQYHEEHAIIAEVDMVVGATVDWYGRLRTSGQDGDTGESKIELLGGDGTYTFYASDKIKAPVHVSLDPAVSGTWNLRGDGKLANGLVRLNVGETEEQYPEMVFIKLTDTTGQIQVKYKPPAPYINGKGYFIATNHLNTLSFPSTGGAVTLSSGMATYFYTPDRTAFSITITLEPNTRQSDVQRRIASIGRVP